jgi:hypothetical protein
VARLGKLTLNAKSLNGGSLQITNVTAALVMEAGSLVVNEQDEYMRQGKTEYLCEDTVDKIPAFDIFLPTGRNIYQEIYFTEHEAIKLDTKDNTWISAVSRVPNSKNDTINVFVYPAEDAAGTFEIDVRAQYTDTNGTVLETGAKNLTRKTDAEGKTVYAVNGLTATSMSTLPSVSRVLIQCPRIITAATVANTDSSDKSSETTVGFDPFCERICKVYATPLDSTPTNNIAPVHDRIASSEGCSVSAAPSVDHSVTTANCTSDSSMPSTCAPKRSTIIM